MTRFDSLSGRDFDTFDPWDVALSQCEPVDFGLRGEVQRRYRDNPGYVHKIGLNLVAVDEQAALRRTPGWFEVPVSPPRVSLPIPISQRADVEVAIDRSDACWSMKRVDYSSPSKLRLENETPEQREKRLAKTREYAQKKRAMAKLPAALERAAMWA